ncbi:hypothetical protein, partial [Pararhodobacter marinus]|uniref:hypothetical protein n=1 Tax=Pararhodobacter marinus TaxID=2184063 RepID=UPI003F80B214
YGSHFLERSAAHQNDVDIRNEGIIAVVFIGVVALQKPSDIAVASSDEAVQTGSDKNMSRDHFAPLFIHRIINARARASCQAHRLQQRRLVGADLGSARNDMRGMHERVLSPPAAGDPCLQVAMQAIDIA